MRRPNERQLARTLSNVLPLRYRYKAFANVNPASANLREYWSEWFSGEPMLAQPDVDLVVADLGDLIGIELKYLRLTRQKDKLIFQSPYYEGIGQAIALLCCGFDYVQLWHCFDQDIDVTKVARSMENTRSLLHRLELPLGYVALRVMREGKEVIPREIHSSFGDPPLLEYKQAPNPRRYVRSELRNPICKEVGAKRMREFIEHILRIPKT